jgi:isopentenyl diphosphate isomerase/L-lactate dehydrogenase-like FMN-dependent dehydrogenase
MEGTRNDAFLGQSPPIATLSNLDEIEEAAVKLISKKTWAYYVSASDDEVTKRLNNAVYRSILFRPRVFRDVTTVDLSTTLLGHRVSVPFYVAPAAMAKLAHPVGEYGIAQACATFGAMQLISANASMSPEQIVRDAIPGQIFGWQLYVQIDRKKSEDMLVRINNLSDKIKFICLTLDAPTPGKRERDQRASKMFDDSVKTAAQADTASQPMNPQSGGIGNMIFTGTDPGLSWKTILPWLKKHTDLPIILKGILTYEDAYIASLHAPQVKGIILSNHGGRALDTSPPPVHTLLEIRKYCPEILEKLEIWIDGGIKRGTDIAKSLCLGAKCVGLGRAPLWGLGAGGVQGVERTFESEYHTNRFRRAASLISRGVC